MAGMNWCNVDLDWAYGDLLKSIHRHTRCLDRAYDVLHDALIRLALVEGRGRIGTPHAYLRIVVRSVLANHGADMARWMPFPDGDETMGEHPDMTAARAGLDRCRDDRTPAPTPEMLTDLRQRLRAVERIIQCLPPRCREVFWLHRVEGFSQPEIASRLGITVKIVERHVMRALIDIRAARDALALGAAIP